VRYPAGHKQQSRERILNAAADLFRRRGIAGTGVDSVMGAAGLTAGAFYVHFRSKDALIAAAVAKAGERAQERWLTPLEGLAGRAWARAFLARYVSEEHRDDLESGCSVPSLAAEVVRSGAPARRTFEQRLRGFFALVAEHSGGEDARGRERAIAAVALSVGGVLLSRVVLDRELSREILTACRTSAERLLELDGARTHAQLRTHPKETP
jgi:TetR/AcrR family transcriptional regulator, transcriptional repressor for nem operon